MKRLALIVALALVPVISLPGTSIDSFPTVFPTITATGLILPGIAGEDLTAGNAVHFRTSVFKTGGGTNEPFRICGIATQSALTGTGVSILVLGLYGPVTLPGTFALSEGSAILAGVDGTLIIDPTEVAAVASSERRVIGTAANIVEDGGGLATQTDIRVSGFAQDRSGLAPSNQSYIIRSTATTASVSLEQIDPAPLKFTNVDHVQTHYAIAVAALDSPIGLSFEGVNVSEAAIQITNVGGATTSPPAVEFHVADVNGVGGVLKGRWKITEAGNLNSMADGGGITIGPGGTLISKSIRATATIDLASIGANACAADQPITVTGAVTGAECVVGMPSTTPALLQGTCFVSAAGTVQLRVCNGTGAASADPASGVYSVRVFNP